MHRFYAESYSIEEGIARLSPEDERHAFRVLRLRSGDRVEIFADEKRYLAELLETPSGGGTARILSSLPSTEPRLQVTLFQALPKSDKMEWIVQKAVELGCARIIPVIMERCVSRPKNGEMLHKRDRWQKIAREAGKQSGRCRIPAVETPLPLHDLIQPASALDTCVVAWEEEKSLSVPEVVSRFPAIRSLGILIGPEGGITPEEIHFLSGRFLPVTLGPRILRTETAGLASLAAFFALYGEMGGLP